MRLLLLLVTLCCCAVGAEQETTPETDTTPEAEAAAKQAPPPPAHSHVFTPGELRLYHYEALQDVTQQNLDDELAFQSLLRWRFALRCAAVDDRGADLVATIFLVQATHDGPGSHHAVDSSKPEPEQTDPVLGHLLRSNGRSLQVRIEQGQVVSVGGGEELIAAIAGSGVDAERRRRVAERSYGPAALRSFWQAVLLQPAAGTQTITLPAPLQGEATRSWQQGAWELAGTGDATVELATRPSPLQATIRQLSGSGRVQISPEGIMQRNEGELRYRCEWLALGQRAAQQHVLRWQLLLIDYKPAP